MWSPPDPGKGVGGDQLMLQAGRGGDLESGWVLVGSWRAPKIMGARRAPKIMGARRAPKIMGARPHPESTQNNGGVPSSCGRFGGSLLFFIAAKS